jgi:mRNA-degrading endonuclease RelE of RelBE toxin-antitoxin system
MQIRKANTKNFPYSLYYNINDETKEVTIFAVIHQHRSEEIWKKRIENQ